MSPRTTWELDVKTKGSRGAKALARDLRELDATLRALDASSGVLSRIAADAASIKGAKVRVRAERAVGDERVRQSSRGAKTLVDDSERVRRSTERAQQRARTDMTDTERMRRAVEAGTARMNETAGRDRARAWQQGERARLAGDRTEQRRLQRQGSDATRAARREHAFEQQNAAWRVRQERRSSVQRDRAQAAHRRNSREAMAAERAGWGDLAGAFGGVFGAAGAFAGVTLGTLSTLASMVGTIGQIVAGLGGATLGMIAFRESSLTTLRVMARDAQGQRLTGAAANASAHETYRFAQQFARETPLDAQEVLSLQRQTTAAGFSGARNREVLMSAADVGALRPDDPAAASHFLLGLGQLRNASSVRTQDLRQTAQASGLGENDILRSIAREAGQTQRAGENDRAYQKRIERMQRTGQFTGEQGVSGVLAALRERNGGEAGSFARGQGATLSGTLSNVRGAVFDFVTSIEDIENLPGIRALKETLNGIVGTLTSAKPLTLRLQAIFAGIVDETAMWFAMAGGKGGIAAMIEPAVAAFEHWYPIVKEVGAAFGDAGWQSFVAEVGPMMREIGDLDASGTEPLVAFVREFGRSGGKVLGFGVKLLALFTAMIPLATMGAGLFVGLMDTAADMPRQIQRALNDGMSWEEIGREMVGGMAAGFGGAGPGFLAEVQSFNAQLVEATRSDLQIHSPSRVFEDIGSQIPAGMSEGIGSGTRAVQNSMAAMTAPPGLAMGGGALGGLGGGQFTFHVTIEGGATREAAESFAQQSYELLLDKLEQGAAMQGG